MHDQNNESVALAAQALRRRARLAAACGEAARLGSLALVLAGAAALLGRAFLGWSMGEAAWTLALLVVVPPVAWIRAARRTPSLESAATWLDIHTGGSGAVVAALERPLDGVWASSADSRLAAGRSAGDLKLPRLRTAPLLRPSAPAAVFSIACLLIPLGSGLVEPPDAKAAIERRAEDLREQLEVLDETISLDDDRVQEFEDRLRAALEQAADGNTESSYEAMDRLELDAEALAQRAAEAAEEALRAMSDAASDMASDPAGAREQLDAMADAMQAAGLDPGELSPELSAALDELASQLEALPRGATGEEGLAALEQLAQELAKMAELSEELREALAKKLGELAEAGLLEGAALPKMEIDPAMLQALIEALKNMDLDKSLCPPSLKPGGT
ncbi:hypothetical protein [Engelhardtia mirabilis]|uniref:Uncharacterized protein n=1 Tax=Engelhardtia mirabilis TaxID=2528011 RepID=A0A518BII7_9BACT|nr:hypothetical protein Pla133_18730 [Planctomycetes bacterium Pla133]QDV01123.1 hypothetical protein Pla86_18720 [Planctomycetes bacterium Pla86]